MVRQIRHFQRRIRFHFLIVGLLVFSMAGTTAILMGVALRSQNRTLTGSTLHSNFEGARNLNVAINTLIRLMFRELGQMPPGPQANADGPKRPAGERLFNAVIEADASGVIRSSAPGDAGLTGRRIPEEAAAKALDSGRAAVTEPFAAPNGHTVVLFVLPRIGPGGEPEGFVGGLIDFGSRNAFSDILEHAVKSKNETYAYLVDPSGGLLMHPDPRRSGEVIGAAELEGKLMQGRERSSVVEDAGGAKYLAGFLTIPELGWGVVYQSPKSAVDEAMVVLIRTQLAWIVPLFGVLLLVSLWVARRLTAPFAALTSAARRISAGERMIAPPFASHWNHEAHHLARAMTRAVGALQLQADRLAEQARRDGLTGLANRKLLEERVAEWMSRETEFAILVLDIDYFKAVNDEFGHRAGDEALVHLARILESETREEDLACRFGGEEFVVLLPEQSMKAARKCAERIRRKMEKTASPTGLPITVSIGLAVCPGHGKDFAQAFERADQALYQAKQGGRNRIAAAGDGSDRAM